MAEARKVVVLLPPGEGRLSVYPSLPEMRRISSTICAVLGKRGIELVAEPWDGSVANLPQDRPCLVHFTCTLGDTQSTLVAACDRYGHLLFCSDRIYNGNERDPSRAVEQWLDTLILA